MSSAEEYFQKENGTEFMAKKEFDVVAKPAHYNQSIIECIDAIEAALTEDELRGYYKGNVLKYTWRERYKNGIEDMRKACWYYDRLVKLMENK